MQILAHRTAMANAPPNSLAGLQFCWEHGISVAECDLSFTYDGKPIIWHDEENHLLEKPVCLLGEYAFEETRKFRRKDSQELLLCVDDLFEFLKAHPGFLLFIDVKYYYKALGLAADFWGIVNPIQSYLICLTVQEVIEPAIAANLANRIGFVTFDGGARLLKTAKEVSPDIHTNLIVVKPWARITEQLGYLDGITIGWGLRGWNHWRNVFTGSVQRLVWTAQENGREVWGGHANDEESLRWLVGNGFNGAWADDVVTAKRYLDNRMLRQLV